MFENFFGRFLTQFVYGGGYKLLLDGLWVTIVLALAGLVIGIAIGVLVAVLRVLPQDRFLFRILSWVAIAYITVIRGVPLAVLLLLGYYGILAPLNWPPLVAGILIFGINSSGYVAEIVRSGIQSVDKGQMEAGRSLGLSHGATMKKIVLPQAIKNILPALGNEWIVLIKETSVAGFITIYELTRAGRAIVANYYDALVSYTVLACVYLVLVIIVTYFVGLLERRMRKSDNR